MSPDLIRRSKRLELQATYPASMPRWQQEKNPCTVANYLSRFAGSFFCLWATPPFRCVMSTTRPSSLKMLPLFAQECTVSHSTILVRTVSIVNKFDNVASSCVQTLYGFTCHGAFVFTIRPTTLRNKRKDNIKMDGSVYQIHVIQARDKWLVKENYRG